VLAIWEREVVPALNPPAPTSGAAASRASPPKRELFDVSFVAGDIVADLGDEDDEGDEGDGDTGGAGATVARGAFMGSETLAPLARVRSWWTSLRPTRSLVRPLAPVSSPESSSLSAQGNLRVRIAPSTVRGMPATTAPAGS
jgi:hypothetical protein